MKTLPEQIQQSIEGRNLFHRRERILVAVSGGLDSMVLLHLLHGLSPQFGWKLVVAHFNHQLRGRASDADERFVGTAAATLGLPFESGRGSVKALAKKRGLSIEMAARELRHSFLARTARRLKCPVIAVAHHANDQVELFLLRLLRGAGGDGLAGMRWRSLSPADKRVQIVRPLLDVSQVALEQFARASRIRFREDASNASSDYLRNRVRHELLPLLRSRFQPALDQTLLRLMDIVGADAEVANEAACAWLKLKADPRRRRLCDCPVGLQRRVIQLQLQEQKVEASFDLIESLRLSPGRPVTVAPGLHLVCDEVGRVRPAPKAHGVFQMHRLNVRLGGASGKVEFSGARIDWRRTARGGVRPERNVPGWEMFDADMVGPRIVLRHWQPGDRFQPIGMGAAVKLQDWFTNRKVSRDRRRELIVATTSAGEIFWIEGQRIGERFKLTTETRRHLVWRWKRAETT